MMRAVLMAGGRSRRMRASGRPQHKTLLEIVGVPLLERNVGYLLAAGFRDLVVVASGEEPEVVEFARTRARDLALARQGTLECVTEDAAQGTIGIVARLLEGHEAAFVMAADNLTSLDPRLLIERHREAGAAMTVATHEFPLRMPYGEVRVEQGMIRQYAEKPVYPVRISSAFYVVGSRAAAAIDRERCDVPELVEKLLAERQPVAALEHASHWIDINDDETLAQAERLVHAHPREFECWPGPPDEEIDCLVDRRGHGIATEPRGDESRPDGSPTTSFDDLNVESGRLVRHHVFQVDLDGHPHARPPDLGISAHRRILAHLRQAKSAKVAS